MLAFERCFSNGTKC